MELEEKVLNYPRVLAVDATAFQRRTDVGILKSNLFQGWPSGSLAQVIIGEDRPEFLICEKYWRITRGNWALQRSGNEVTTNSSEELPRFAAETNRLRSRKWSDQLFGLLAYLPVATPLPISKEFWDWLSEFRPELIFTIGGALAVLSAARCLSDAIGIPIIPLFTDDWIKWKYQRGPIDVFLRHRLTKAFRNCLLRSPMRLAVSEAMTEEYSRRYSGTFLPCMDLVMLDEFCYEPYELQVRPVKFLFVGYLEPERWRSLKLLEESLVILRTEGVDVSLDIYTFPDQVAKYGSMLHSPPVCNVRGAVPFAEVPRLLKDADVLVHVEAFSLHNDAEIALSFSTKIPQYMAAGRAILGVGPASLASMRYLENSGAGIVVGEQNCQALTETVRRLARDADLRTSLAHRARQTAETNHNATTGRRRFMRILSEAAGFDTSKGDYVEGDAASA